MNLSLIYILLYFTQLTSSATDDPECTDSEYIGFSFTPPTYSQEYDSFSEFGLSRLQNITFDIKLDCSEYNLTHTFSPPMFLHITNNPSILDPDTIQDLVTIAEIKQQSLDDPIPRQVWIENITRWIDDVWYPYVINETNARNDTILDINTTTDLPNWRNIWLLTTDLDDITTLCNHSTTPAPFTTSLTFSWASQYTQLFPIFQNYETTKDLRWIDDDTDMPLVTIWKANETINDTLYYNMVIWKEDSEWIQCFIQKEDNTNANNNNWQSTMLSYHFDNDMHNMSNHIDEWKYTLHSEAYTPLISYTNCNVTEFDGQDKCSSSSLCCYYSNSASFFNIYFWYDDDVWTNSLAYYQRLTQYAIEEALCDVYKEHFGEILLPNEFYLSVSYFFNFCLLKNGGCPNYGQEKEAKQLTFFPSKIDTAVVSGYKMYATFRTKPVQNAEKIWEMLADNKDNVELFETYIVRRAKEDFGRYNFEIHGMAIGDLPQRIIFRVPQYIGYAVYSFVIGCTLFALAGAIHGFVYWGADCIRISGIVYFGLYTWDFYSDIVFDLELLNYDDTELMFYACSAFILIPWIGNMVSLSRYQQRWCKDDAIRERVYSWFVSWQRLTYALSAVSGSAFGTVELANSYVFGLDFFCMGLNERHLKRFNNNRLWSGILLENVPQLVIQLWFLRTLDWEPNNNVVWLAIVSSTLSVGAALLDIYSAKKLFDVLEPGGQALGQCACTMHILSREIKENAKKLKISTYALRDAIAETLTTHPRSVEMHFPITTADGFKVGFTVFSSKLEPEVIYSRLKKNATTKLPQKIKNVWRLKHREPVIPLEELVVAGVDPTTWEDPEPEEESSVREGEGVGAGIEMVVTKTGKISDLLKEGDGVKRTNDTAINMIDSFKMTLNDDGGQLHDDAAVSDYEAQVASLNAQIAMNQYLMMKQMEYTKVQNEDNTMNEIQRLMVDQMQQMNDMINMTKAYDVNSFQDFNKQWQEHRKTYEPPTIPSNELPIYDEVKDDVEVVLEDVVTDDGDNSQ